MIPQQLGSSTAREVNLGVGQDPQQPTITKYIYIQTRLQIPIDFIFSDIIPPLLCLPQLPNTSCANIYHHYTQQ